MKTYAVTFREVRTYCVRVKAKSVQNAITQAYGHAWSEDLSQRQPDSVDIDQIDEIDVEEVMLGAEP